jgi:hypothetical protein
MDRRVNKPVALGTKQIYRVYERSKQNDPRLRVERIGDAAAGWLWQGRGLDRNDGGSMAVARHARSHL